jgi:hypothetical protein
LSRSGLPSLSVCQRNALSNRSIRRSSSSNPWSHKSRMSSGLGGTGFASGICVATTLPGQGGVKLIPLAKPVPPECRFDIIEECDEQVAHGYSFARLVCSNERASALVRLAKSSSCPA